MLQHLMQVLFDEQINLAVILQTLSRKHLTEVFYTGAAQKRAIVRAFFFFFFGTYTIKVRGVFAQGWRSP
jgi:hypothetical protein